MNPLWIEASRLQQRLLPFLQAPAATALDHALRDIWRQALPGRLARARTRLGRLAREPAVGAGDLEPPGMAAQRVRAALLTLTACHADIYGAYQQVTHARSRIRWTTPTRFGAWAGDAASIATSKEREAQRREREATERARRRAERAGLEALDRELQRALDAWERDLAGIAADVRSLASWLMAEEEARLEGVLRLADASAAVRAAWQRLPLERRELEQRGAERPGRFGALLRAHWLAPHHHLLGSLDPDRTAA